MGLACHVSACGCGSAGGRDQRRNRGQLERIEDAQSAADRDARDRRAAVDARAACPLGDGDHPVAAFLRRSHPGPGQILASGRLAGHASTGAPICYCLPARQQDCFPAVCAQTCGSLVRNGAEPVHRQWKCWGFCCLTATMTGPFTWENASRILCMQRKPEISTCHAAIDN
jgi:hypothetical protein